MVTVVPAHVHLGEYSGTVTWLHLLKSSIPLASPTRLKAWALLLTPRLLEVLGVGRQEGKMETKGPKRERGERRM